MEVSLIVQGGKATPGPPLGPALSPLGLNIGEIVKEINEKTKMFEGMEVPVKVIVDEKKEVKIEVGSPSVSALIKKKLGLEKLATVDDSGKRVLAGDLKINDIIEIAKSKVNISGDLKAKVKQVLGTCVSVGVTVNGKDPRNVIQSIEKGEIKIE